MTFFVKNADTTQFASITDGTLDTSSSLTLVGKNYPTYGEIFNQNFFSLLQNFAYVNAPVNPVQGQIWYDSANLVLKTYRVTVSASYWQPVAYLVQSSSAPATAVNGDLWWDTNASQLKIYYGNSWIIVGPQTSTTGLIRVTGSNSLIYQIGGLNVWQIDNYGRANAPFNPTVQVWDRYNTDPNSVTFTGSGITVMAGYVPVNVSVDIGGCFDPVTGIFTCPIAGIYEVAGHMETLGGPADSQQHIIMFWHNQSDSGIKASNFHNIGFSQTLSIKGLIQAAAGDTIQFVFSASQGAQINDQYSGFSVRLVS
jgi:C1q domain